MRWWRIGWWTRSQYEDTTQWVDGACWWNVVGKLWWRLRE